MTVSKETLLAYVDGELDAAASATVEAAIAADPQLRQEVDRQRALRLQLQSAFDGVLHEPVPDRLISAARTAPTAAQQTTVADFERARAGKAEKTRRRWSLPEWTAMAACLVIGLFLGHQLLRPSDAGLLATENGQVVARGSLAQALSSQLASTPSPRDTVHVALSFRDHAGNYCRTFTVTDSSALSGLACRENESWRVHVLAEGAKPAGGEGGYRMAAGDLPASVLQTVQARIDGDPLDAAAEAAAQRNHWR